MISLRPLAEVIKPAELLARIPHELVVLRDERRPWTSYVAFSVDGTAVGTCAFKTVPSEKKEVEIAYYTFRQYERRGYGLAMARELVDIAASSNEVDHVIAQTLREENASVRICRNLRFLFAGEVLDPEDGLVWRWKYKPPNQELEPMIPGVTPGAEAKPRVAPPGIVAHL